MSKEFVPSLDSRPPADQERIGKCKKVATIVYALQAVSLLLGGLTLVVAVILNYVKNPDAKGSWLESHFRWQIRTFWFMLLWIVVGVVLVYMLIGIPILIAATIWLIYRVVKGWMFLAEGKEMYRTA